MTEPVSSFAELVATVGEPGPAEHLAPAPAADAVPAIELVEVTRSFPGPPVVNALHPVNLTVMPGEYLSIIGPSGSGKSTLLNLLGLLDRPTSGIYRLAGEDTAAAKESRRAHLRAQRIGFVFQSFQLLPQRSVLENVLLATAYSAMPRGERHERATAALDRVGLSHRTEFLPTLLSGGERQRVAIARAVVSGAGILLADEPTGNLDSTSALGVLDLFDDLNADGITMVLITHDLSVAARAHRRVRIADGYVNEVA